MDENRNGILDGEEGGIPDIRIEVWASIAEEYAQDGLGLQPELYTHTDLEGYYRFEVVLIGDYVVCKIDPGEVDPEISNQVPVTVLPGQMVEVSFRAVPFSMSVYLPLILMDGRRASVESVPRPR